MYIEMFLHTKKIYEKKEKSYILAKSAIYHQMFKSITNVELFQN